MNRSLLSYLYILLAVWIAAGIYLCNRFLIGKSSPFIHPRIIQLNQPTTNPDVLSATDGPHFKTNCPDGLDFLNASDSLVEIPVSLQNCLEQTGNYLKENPDRKLTISGLYSVQENPAADVEELGETRAQAIKAYFMKMGVPDWQLGLASKMMDPKYSDLDTIFGAALFSFEEVAPKDLARIRAIRERFAEKAVELYFGPNQRATRLNAQQEQDFEDLKYYLSIIPEASLEIIGHSDAVGNKLQNQFLSKKRAEYIKYLLTKTGISSDRLSISSFGIEQPIGDNSTGSGRAKNRRVEVFLR